MFDNRAKLISNNNSSVYSNSGITVFIVNVLNINFNMNVKAGHILISRLIVNELINVKRSNIM